jgi:outer membrane protein assembly factor BamB
VDGTALWYSNGKISPSPGSMDRDLRMNKLMATMAAVVLAATTAAADQYPNVYTRPTVPPREALDRLDLVLGWRTFLPMDGQKDGIATIQLAGKEIFVQTRSGLLMSLDAETGDVRWSVRPGNTYRNILPVAWNAKSVIVVSTNVLSSLERSTGMLEWEYTLPSTPTAPPAVDDRQVYLAVGSGRVVVYRMLNAGPEFEEKKLDFLPSPKPETTRPGETANSNANIMSRHRQTTAPGPYTHNFDTSRPNLDKPPVLDLRYDHPTQYRIEQPPLVSAGILFLAAASGTETGDLTSDIKVKKEGANVSSASRDRGAARGTILGMRKTAPVELYELPVEGLIAAKPAQYGETAYLASLDYNLYAINMVSGRTQWRFTGPAPILRRPAVLEEEVFVVPETSELFRLSRATGDPMWPAPAAGISRFLSASSRCVYARDRNGRLVVLDRKRGTPLATYDTIDYVVPLTNDLTDRIYLAAHNGLLVCLHDRFERTPLFNRLIEEGREGVPDAKTAKKAPADKGKEGEDAKAGGGGGGAGGAAGGGAGAGAGGAGAGAGAGGGAGGNPKPGDQPKPGGGGADNPKPGDQPKPGGGGNPKP